jgi:Domain of unknown function (DUF5122) beta-propeller
VLQSAHAMLLVTAVIWLAACSGSDDSTPQSTTSQSPTTSQEPTKPPPTTPTTAPPGPAPGSGSGGTGSGGTDGTFNQGYGFNGLVRTIVMAQDGTRDLYVGGDFTNYNGTPTNRLIRIHPNGTVAQAFGQGFDQPVIVLAPATDGSNALYVGGWFTQFSGQAAPKLVRLTSNGLRDSTFQVDQFFGQDAFQSTFVIDLAVTEDGSRDVYVAGNVVEGVPGTPVDRIVGRVVRLNPDGSPDPAFADVRYVGPPDLNSEMVWAIAVPDGSGKVYVGGTLAGAPGGLIRLNPDGTIDSTFTGVAGNAGTIELAVDGSRDIYAGGLRAFGPIRVHETGALDTTFSPTEPITTLGTYAIAVAVDGTGDVVVSAFSRLLRLNRNGDLAPTFQEPTLSPALPGPNGDHSVYAMAPIPDGTGDLYIGGAFSAYNGAPANNFARIHADGSLASTGTALP